jgi:hypothetical protein
VAGREAQPRLNQPLNFQPNVGVPFLLPALHWLGFPAEDRIYPGEKKTQFQPQIIKKITVKMDQICCIQTQC